MEIQKILKGQINPEKEIWSWKSQLLWTQSILQSSGYTRVGKGAQTEI